MLIVIGNTCSRTLHDIRPKPAIDHLNAHVTVIIIIIYYYYCIVIYNNIIVHNGATIITFVTLFPLALSLASCSICLVLCQNKFTISVHIIHFVKDAHDQPVRCTPADRFAS